MATIFDDLKKTYQMGNTVIRFIFINVAVFLVLTLIRIAGFLYQTDFVNGIMPWISGSSSWEHMLYRPWTIVTYMFVQEGFWHMFMNMILLYFAGRLFADLLNEKRFVAVYFLGGLAGFLTYFIAYNVFPVFDASKSIIYGASASVIAILVAIATYTPNLEWRLAIIGSVKLKYIAIFFVAIDVLFLDGGNTGGRLAHLGGALFGFLFSLNLKKGNDWSKGFYAFTGFFESLVKPKKKMKVASRQSPGYKTQYYPKDSKEEKTRQQKIDIILDKISRSGYDSLSKEEKETLFKASKK
jgi:membrane associated rhomboid family serine protease